jgi:hypothetical protein
MLDGLRGSLLPSIDLFLDDHGSPRVDGAKIAAMRNPTEGGLVEGGKATAPPLRILSQAKGTLKISDLHYHRGFPHDTVYVGVKIGNLHRPLITSQPDRGHFADAPSRNIPFLPPGCPQTAR